jgi:mono/diheme cytochrome c family protein
MQPADLATESSASEEWWFAWYSALVALLPPTVAPTFRWLFPVALFLVLILLPFLDRSPHRGWHNRPVATTLVVLLVLAILGLSWLRYQSPWTGRPSAETPAVPRGVVLAADAEQGRQLFPKYGCTSCHSVSGSGQAKVGTDLARMSHVYSQAELRHYILQPPAGVAMPSYVGRFPEEDLDRVVAFVLVAQTFRRNQE